MKIRDGEEVMNVEAIRLVSKTPIIGVVSKKGRVLLCKAEEVGLLSGPGRGVTVIKLDSSDRLLASRLLYQKDDQLVALKQEGTKLPISIRKYQPVGRGGKGYTLFKRGNLKGVQAAPIELPVLDSENGKNSN
jgi:DNA gyrase subunit A